MKKRKLLLPLLVAVILMLPACDDLSAILLNDFPGFYSGEYDNSDNYSIGNFTCDKCPDQLSINWYAGNIEFKTHDDSCIKVVESSDKSISDPLTLRWLSQTSNRDITNLDIQFAESQKEAKQESSKNQSTEFTKNLVIYVPKNHHFSKITITANKTNVTVNGISADTLTVLCSPDESLINVNCIADSYVLNGNTITMSADHQISDISAFADNSVTLNLDDVTSATVKCTNGDLNLTCDDCTTMNLYNSKGTITLNCDIFHAINVETFAAPTVLNIGKEQGFEAKIDLFPQDPLDEKSIGTVLFDFDVEKDEDGSYIYGDGNAVIYVSTSNNVFVNHN